LQSVQDELKEDKKQMEELIRLREHHKKQLSFLTDTRQELERQKAEMLAEYNSLKNGTTASVCSELTNDDIGNLSDYGVN